MNQVFTFFFEQYATYETIDIVLEIIAVVFGFLSVWFSKQNKIWVFPTGMISTSIFVYLLLKWGLLGDMMINGYYFIMSVYGWYVWTRKIDDTQVTPISKINFKEKKISVAIFIATLLFVFVIYKTFDKWSDWVAYADTITTAIFFVGMWLMAKRKIENWIFWIIGDIISVPLYLYKGFTFTSFQYLGFTFIAIFGYLAWKKKLKQTESNCIKVVLFGPESTGKTTLAKQIARYYNSVWVPEYAREYLQKKWNNERKTCEQSDLLPIAVGQMEVENRSAKKTDSVLVCDTDLLETKVYSEEYYDGDCDPHLNKYAIENNYDLYLLTYIDTPWEADDLRDRPEERLEMFNSFEKALKDYNRPYILLKGDKKERLEMAVKHIDKLLNKEK